MFQRTFVKGRFTLAVMGVLAAVAWAVLPPPTSWMTLLGFLACAFCVYLLAELNNSFALLRVSSRTISCMLVLMLMPVTMLHELQTGHLLLLFGVLVYFPLLAIYQRPWATTLVFLAFLTLSVASVAFPPLLYFVPVCWVSMVLLRAMSLRAWMASLLGLVTPYCFVATWAYCTDQLPRVSEYLLEGLSVDFPDYSSWTLLYYIVAALALLHFGIGAVEFLVNKHQDKTRTRFHYYTVLLHGCATFLWLLIQPQHFQFIFPLCIVNAALFSGHFTALCLGRVQNIIVILLFLFTLAACVVAAAPF